MTSSSGDHSKVALCSAIFAGVAYVGYSVVKQAWLKRGSKNKQGKQQQHDHEVAVEVIRGGINIPVA